jgi:hypothetical protein
MELPSYQQGFLLGQHQMLFSPLQLVQQLQQLAQPS